MSALIPKTNALFDPTSEINMVAEPSVMIGTLGEINMMGAGPDPAAPFDPVESERKVKELIAENVNKAFEALRAEFRTDMLTLNAKFDTVKAAQDINDGVIKDVVNRQAQFLDVEFAGVKVTFDKAEALIKTMNATLQQLTAEVNIIKASGVTVPPGFNTTTRDSPMKPRSIMEHKVIQNVDKLTSSPGDYFIWSLRFKNAMSQVDVRYKELLESAEKLRVQIPTYEYWEAHINHGLVTAVGSEEEATTLKKDLYTVLVEKCTNTQVIQFANEAEDGFYAFFNL